MKRQYHHGQLREALLEAAPTLIQEVGLEKFGLRQLAKEIGVTHPAVYKHFKDKSSLLAELALAGHQSLSRRVTTQRNRHTSMSEQLKAVSLTYFRWASEHSGIYQIMFGPRLNTDGEFPELETAIDCSFQAIDEVFSQHGVPENQVRSRTVSLVTMLHGYCEMVRLKRIRVTSKKAAETYLLTNLEPFLWGVLPNKK